MITGWQPSTHFNPNHTYYELFGIVMDHLKEKKGDKDIDNLRRDV